MKEIHVMDFDGTITCRDSFADVIRFSRPASRILLGILIFSPLITLMKLHLYDNSKAKQKVFAFFFKGMDKHRFQNIMTNYGRQWKKIVRPEAAMHIRQLLADGKRVAIVSASIDGWMTPIVNEMSRELQGSIELACTIMETADGVPTGRFATPNCYGAEKVRRLKQILPDRREWTVIAYGDSKGDQQLFEYADQHHYKPFR